MSNPLVLARKASDGPERNVSLGLLLLSSSFLMGGAHDDRVGRYRANSKYRNNDAIKLIAKVMAVMVGLGGREYTILSGKTRYVSGYVFLGPGP